MCCMVLAVLFLQWILVATGCASQAEQENHETGAAPPFELKDLEGNTVRLNDFRNEKAVLIYFWATWCPSCVTVHPDLTRLREEISDQELEILGINVGSGDSLERVKRFEKRYPSQWPVLYDEGSAVTRNYGVQGIPLFIVVDSNGREVFRGNGLPGNPMAYAGE